MTKSRRICLLLLLTGISAPRAHCQGTTQPTPVIRWGPNTVEWGFFDASTKPILTIKSGDTVSIETPLAGSKEMEDMGLPQDLIRPEMRELEAGVKDRGAGANILVGPVFVEGAEPGDVLEIQILDVTPADNYAVNVFHPGGGALANQFPYFHARAIPLDKERNVAIAGPGIEIPLHPFFGTMGVAPAIAIGRISDGPPGYYAGNLDNKHLVAGTTLYIPVQVKGALFSVGDGHAGQGDGEVDGTAIEAALWGKFRFNVRKDMKLRWPRAETPDSIMTMGFDPDLNLAAEMAVRQMVEYLVSERHMLPVDAYVLCSLAVDLQVTQIVDGVKGVHAMLPKKIFLSK
jgi:acetamidase/formamidase